MNPRRRRADLWHSLWLFAITFFVFLALVQNHNQTTDAKNFGEDANARACVAIPIQVKALRAAVAVGIVTPKELQDYTALVPDHCPE